MTVTRHSPPPLVVRTTIAAFAVVAFVLSAVLAPGVTSGTGSLRSTVSDRPAAPQRILPALGQSREPPAQALFQALPIIGSSQSGDEPAVERATLDAARRSTVVGS